GWSALSPSATWSQSTSRMPSLSRTRCGSTSRHSLACFWTKHPDRSLRARHEHETSVDESSFREEPCSWFPDLVHLRFVSSWDGRVSAVHGRRLQCTRYSAVAGVSSWRVHGLLRHSYGDVLAV